MEGQARDWHYFGGGFLVLGAALLGVRATLVAVATPHPAFFNWYADLGLAFFGLAFLCGLAAAADWKFPLSGFKTPQVRGRRIPKWRDRIDEMQPRQIAHLEALERERAGYVKRGIAKSVREVNKQMKIARDAWWETEPEPDPPDPQERSREIGRAAKMLGTELRDIRSKIDRAKAAGFYTRGFQFPGMEFTRHYALLSEHPDLYEKVEPAYAAAQNVNQTLRWREAQQGEGTDLLAVHPQDGLDATHGAAGEALDALGERHNEPFRAQPAAPRPEQNPVRDPVMRRHSEIIIDQIGDDNARRAEVSQLITRGFALKGEVRNPTLREMTSIGRDIVDGNLRSRLDRWCIDARGFIAANVYGVPSGLISEESEAEMLAEGKWTKDSVTAVLDAHLGVLKRARDAISPTRLG